MRFKNQVALITAASAGIGRATAEIIASEGGSVIGVSTDPEKLGAAMEAIRGGGGNAHARVANVLDAACVSEMVNDVVQEFGRIDVLVNGVGGGTVVPRPAAPVDELSLDEWHRVIDFNLDGTFLCCHSVVPVMKQQRRGKIVNIASIAARGLAANSGVAYAAAKGGIVAFTRKLAFELGPFGINVNAISPSLTLTERIRPKWEGRTAEERAREVDRTPLGRVAEASDQARVICFFASHDADFVTGVTIDVTGGV